MNNYQVFGRVGQGAHGYVLKAINKTSEEEVALKKILIKNLNEGIPKSVMREITALRVLKSKHIVHLFEVIPHGMGLILVMEYLPLSLYDMLHDVEYSINDSEIKCYMKMILLGLKYMHENSIMHRDLKPANLLIASDGSLKIADLGLARIYSTMEPKRQYSHQVATRWYRAPELLYGSRNYTPAVDLWAVGCIMAELVNKTPLFPGETDIEQLALVLHTLGNPTRDNWPTVAMLPDYNKITFSPSAGVSWKTIVPDVDDVTRDLIKSFIRYDHTKRPSARRALVNEYFFVKPEICLVENMPKPENLKRISAGTPDIDDFDSIVGDLEDITF